MLSTCTPRVARGTRLRCHGEIRRGPLGLEIVHPEYRRVDRDAGKVVEEPLTPIYPGTEGITAERKPGRGAAGGQRAGGLPAPRRTVAR